MLTYLAQGRQGKDKRGNTNFNAKPIRYLLCAGIKGGANVMILQHTFTIVMLANWWLE